MARQTGPQGGTGFRMLRAQFWTLARSKYISEGTQKWTLSGSKVVPPGGPVFGSLHFVRCAEVLQAAMCAECQAWSYWHKQHPRQDSWTGEARICVSNFSYLLGPKNRPFGVTGRSKSHPNDHLLDSWAGTSARDRPDIPPAPPKQRFKNASFCKVKTLLWSS